MQQHLRRSRRRTRGCTRLWAARLRLRWSWQIALVPAVTALRLRSRICWQRAAGKVAWVRCVNARLANAARYGLLYAPPACVCMLSLSEVKLQLKNVPEHCVQSAGQFLLPACMFAFELLLFNE